MRFIYFHKYLFIIYCQAYRYLEPLDILRSIYSKTVKVIFHLQPSTDIYYVKLYPRVNYFGNYNKR